nr:MAG TPA: hypothetical protein [Caudoviricetes sp.]
MSLPLSFAFPWTVLLAFSGFFDGYYQGDRGDDVRPDTQDNINPVPLINVSHSFLLRYLYYSTL